MPVCQQCGGPMKRKTKSETNWGGCACVLVAIGLGILLSIIGLWIIGVPLILLVIIISPFAASKSQKFWRCPQCRVGYQRL